MKAQTVALLPVVSRGRKMSSQPFHPDLRAVDPVNLLRAAADPVRLHVLNVLADGEEHTCSGLADLVGIPLPTMSHHLKTLREAGLTFNRKDGTIRWTSLRSADLEQQFPGLVSQFIFLARALRSGERLKDS